MRGSRSRAGGDLTALWSTALLLAACVDLEPRSPSTARSPAPPAPPDEAAAGLIGAHGASGPDTLDRRPQTDECRACHIRHRAHQQPFAVEPLSVCQGCHGIDLRGSEPAPSCDTCHAAGWRTSCTFCHGDRADGTGAPPRALSGATAATTRAVGAHVAHVRAAPGRISPPLADCTSCHVRPASVDSPGHIDDGAPAEVIASAGWDPASGTCANACHGVFEGGLATNRPIWTATGQAACGSCHPLPPTAGGRHAAHAAAPGGCAACHPDVDAAGSAIVAPALHVNGRKDVALQGGSYQASTCTTPCHVTLVDAGNPTAVPLAGRWRGPYHPPEWMAPTSPSFHGRFGVYAPGSHGAIEPAPCVTCHGTDLRGGRSGGACSNADCHAIVPDSPGHAWPPPFDAAVPATCAFCHRAI